MRAFAKRNRSLDGGSLLAGWMFSMVDQWRDENVNELTRGSTGPSKSFQSNAARQQPLCHSELERQRRQSLPQVFTTGDSKAKRILFL
jgi:hypothetical protein